MSEYRCVGTYQNGNQCQVVKQLNENLYCGKHLKQDETVEATKCIRCGGVRVHYVRPNQLKCTVCDKQWETE